MRMPAIIQQYLVEQGVHCDLVARPKNCSPQEIAHQLEIPESALIRAVLLQDEHGVVMALLPASYMLNFEALHAETARDFDVVSGAQAVRIFRDCLAESRPALPGAFGMAALRDIATQYDAQVYIESGNGESLLRFSQHDFTRLLTQSTLCHFAVAPENLRLAPDEPVDNVVFNQFLPTRLKQRVQETYDLPAMPEIAQEIMKLRIDPNASARDLANIVMRDPSLAAQVMSWANSPYYGFSGRINSVEMAIMRVLGFEMVLNLALGISVGRSLKVPHDGPLGLRAFWIQAVLTAVLAEKLCAQIKSPQRPQRGLVYLSGLLHNIGHLLLGHVFPPQFFLINRYVAANPDTPVSIIEQHVLGVTHEEIGSWLMQAWHMPEELQVSTRWHHEEEFSSPYAAYSNIVLVASRLLRRINIGDATSTQLPPAVLHLLHLQEDDVLHELSRLHESRSELEQLAARLVA